MVLQRLPATKSGETRVASVERVNHGDLYRPQRPRNGTHRTPPSIFASPEPSAPKVLAPKPNPNHLFTVSLSDSNLTDFGPTPEILSSDKTSLLYSPKMTLSCTFLTDPTSPNSAHISAFGFSLLPKLSLTNSWIFAPSSDRSVPWQPKFWPTSYSRPQSFSLWKSCSNSATGGRIKTLSGQNGQSVDLFSNDTAKM